MAPSQWHNIVVCCDGTWCGAETGTRTNIQILADAFASQDPGLALDDPCDIIHVQDGAEHSRFNEKTNTDVVYFDGVGTSGIEAEHEPEGLGLAGGLLDMLVYCINGAVARDLDERCKEAYRFIKDKYKGPDKSRIWLFGLSRGAYTVRAVAGMINNCGIIKKDWAGVPGETLEYSQEVLLDAVWDIYKSNDADCHPKGDTSKKFKRTEDKVWPKGLTPPIKFMGLLDTVGAVGLPRISGVGAKPLTYDYVSLRDLAVSTEVQNVFQACSTHDRLTPFEPCFVRRSKQYDPNCIAMVDQLKAARINANVPKYDVKYTTEEVWYPGAHYDLGRQDFIIGNQPFTNSFTKRVNLFRTNVKCLPELADYPLVGYELQPKQGDPAPPLCSLASYPPCIVGRVCSIDPTLLPPPSDANSWTALVKGKPPSKGSQCWVLSVAAAVVVFVGRNIPGPVKLFMPPYDVDAETEILGSLAKYAGVVVKGRYDAEVVLKDRSIPLPGVDDWGFRLVGKAEFFPVPKDGGGHTSYEAHGRERNQGGKWFMSQTYNKYISDFIAGRKNSGEKKWAAIWAVGRQKTFPLQGHAAEAARQLQFLQEPPKQQQQDQDVPGGESHFAFECSANAKQLEDAVPELQLHFPQQQQQRQDARAVEFKPSAKQAEDPGVPADPANMQKDAIRLQAHEGAVQQLREIAAESSGVLWVQSDGSAEETTLLLELSKIGFHQLCTHKDGIIMASSDAVQLLQLQSTAGPGLGGDVDSSSTVAADAARAGGNNQSQPAAGNSANSDSNRGDSSSGSNQTQPAVQRLEDAGLDPFSACSACQLENATTGFTLYPPAPYIFPVKTTKPGDTGLVFKGKSLAGPVSVEVGMHICVQPPSSPDVAFKRDVSRRVCIKLHSLYASLGVPDPEGTKAIGISWVYLNLAVTEGSVAVPLRHQAGSLPKPLQELTVPFDISMRGFQISAGVSGTASATPQLVLTLNAEQEKVVVAAKGQKLAVMELAQSGQRVLSAAHSSEFTDMNIVKLEVERNIFYTAVCNHSHDLTWAGTMGGEAISIPITGPLMDFDSNHSDATDHMISLIVGVRVVCSTVKGLGKSWAWAGRQGPRTIRNVDLQGVAVFEATATADVRDTGKKGERC